MKIKPSAGGGRLLELAGANPKMSLPLVLIFDGGEDYNEFVVLLHHLITSFVQHVLKVYHGRK